jgi:ABC-type dipeptide/oligopeptide/nickel transport system permease subunit
VGLSENAGAVVIISYKDIFKNKAAVVSVGFIAIVALIAVFADLLAPFKPAEVFAESIKSPPFWAEGHNPAFILGTDDVGRDLLSRLIHGSRFSLFIGLLVVVSMLTLGTLLGLISGSIGGRTDALIMRIMDIMMALPSVLTAIVIVSILGPSLINTVIAIAIVQIPYYVRIVRSSVMVENSKNYVVAARSYGASWFRIYFINVLPNCLGPILVQATFGFSEGILNAAALGFLGLGVQAPTPEWGTMLSDSRAYIQSAPELVFLPGICILLVVVSFNILGDSLRDVFDPKVHKA